MSVFYSYAHEDEALREELEKQLAILSRSGIITEWHDRNISAGEEWAAKISRHLEEAQIILLLVSADFISSDFCYNEEMTRALERHKAGEARVIPIIIRAAVWEEAPFAALQALPKDGKPITSWSNRDEAWADVARGIRRVCAEMLAERAATPSEDKPSRTGLGEPTPLVHDDEPAEEQGADRARSTIVFLDEARMAAAEYVESMKPIPPEAPQFYMASCLVSNELYHHFVCADETGHLAAGKAGPEYLKHWLDGKPREGEDRLPVTYVSFHAAKAFAEWLGFLTGYHFSLPTYEVWKRAAVANRSALWFRDEYVAGRVNYFNTAGRLRSVDAFKPNPFGIRDLLGNAFDMCVPSDSQGRGVLLAGGCYYSTTPKLLELRLVEAQHTCRRDTSFRCIRSA